MHTKASSSFSSTRAHSSRAHLLQIIQQTHPPPLSEQYKYWLNLPPVTVMRMVQHSLGFFHIFLCSPSFLCYIYLFLLFVSFIFFWLESVLFLFSVFLCILWDVVITKVHPCGHIIFVFDTANECSLGYAKLHLKFFSSTFFFYIYFNSYCNPYT